jgi:Ca2+-binding EF-hand superfamily protein
MKDNLLEIRKKCRENIEMVRKVDAVLERIENELSELKKGIPLDLDGDVGYDVAVATHHFRHLASSELMNSLQRVAVKLEQASRAGQDMIDFEDPEGMLAISDREEAIIMDEWERRQEEDSEALKIFRYFDLDGNGSIDREEFEVMMHVLQAESPDQFRNDDFGTLDTNGDGEISFEEFEAWWNSNF